MVPWRRLFLLLLVARGAAAADDGSPPDSVTWRCWYDQEVHITCLVDSIADVGIFDTLPSPIPSIALEIRRDFGPERKFFVHIPLHARPEDTEFTAQLARSVVCGSRTDCNVDFSMDRPSAEEIDALLMQGLSAAEPNDKPQPPRSSAGTPPPD